jgi:hypothetical protein
MFLGEGKTFRRRVSLLFVHDQVNETILHLFFECQSSTARWFLLGIQWLPVLDICQKLQHQKEISQAPTSWICLPLRLGAFGRKGINLSSTTKLLGCLDGKEYSGLKLYFTFIGYLSTKEC